MHVLWALAFLAVGLSRASSLEGNADVGEKAVLRFMRRDGSYSNSTTVTSTIWTSSPIHSTTPKSSHAKATSSIDSLNTTSSPSISPSSLLLPDGPTTTSTQSLKNKSGLLSSGSSPTISSNDTKTATPSTKAPKGPGKCDPDKDDCSLSSGSSSVTSSDDTKTATPSTKAPKGPGKCDPAKGDCSLSAPIKSPPPSSTSTSSPPHVSSNTTKTDVSSSKHSKTASKLPSFTGGFSNHSTPRPTCVGSVTYLGSVPPTVFVTVTEGFNVTVTASNVSFTVRPILITPPPACSATVIPLDQTSTTDDSTATDLNPELPHLGSKPPPANEPSVVTATENPEEGSPEASDSIYSTVAYTSTVIVTKKTPVTVVVPATTSPGVNFNMPSQTPTPVPTNGGGGGANNPPANGGNTPAPNVPLTTSPNAFASVNNGGGSLIINPASASPPGIGNIIASIANPPYATATVPAPAPAPVAAAPLTTSLGGVPVVVLPSNSVAIGSQTILIPNLIATTVQVSGVVFTVEPSQIIGPSATVALAQAQKQQLVTPIPTATITTVVGDLTLTVGPTAAVIAGTTYRIGSGATPTTVVVAGTSISIGADGVGLPSTTVAPGGVSPYVVYTTDGLTFSVGSSIAIVSGTTYRVGSNAPEVTATIGSQHLTVTFGTDGVALAKTTLAPGASPFVVVTAEGLTFSIDGTEAIISGTTYRIGSGAPKMTTSIGSGHASVSFGPGGVGLASTTIHPTTPSTPSAGTGSRSTSSSPSQTASNDGTSNHVPISSLAIWGLIGVFSLWFAI